jgi:hypothetical protein
MKRETSRALAIVKKITRLNKREAELLASIPTDMAVDNVTLKKMVTYSSFLKRQSALLAELETILKKKM